MNKFKKTKKKENNKCFVYKSCDHVPCGHGMNKCTP